MSETVPHHRLNLTPVQFATWSKIVAWMKTDPEYKEASDGFVIDDKWRSLTADRFTWNMFRRASEIWACQNETHPLDSVRRDADVLAMFGDKSSVVQVAERVKAGLLF